MASPVASQIPERSRRGAGAGFNPAYAVPGRGALFHFSILMSSTDFGGAVWARARRIGNSAEAKISVVGNVIETERFGIWKLLPKLGFDLEWPSGSGLELLPIDLDAAFEASDRPPVLCRRDVNHHLIAGLECGIAPARGGLSNRILAFNHPMQCVAAVILRVDFQKDVGIRPNVVGHRSLDRHRFCRVVGRVSVMRQQR